MDTEQQKQHLSAGGLETESAAFRRGPVGATCQTGLVRAGQGALPRKLSLVFGRPGPGVLGLKT